MKKEFSNKGRLCEIIDGVHKGKYALMPNDRQSPSFSKLGKCLVMFYEDIDLQKPIKEGGKNTIGLIQAKFLKVIGYID